MRITLVVILMSLLSAHSISQDTSWVLLDTSIIQLKDTYDQSGDFHIKAQLWQRFELEPTTFGIYGISIPFAATGTVGFPQSRLDISYFIYRQTKPNRANRIVFNVGNCYDLYNMDVSSYPTGDLKFYRTRYKPATFSKTKSQQTTIGYGIENGLPVYYSTEQQLPITRQSGFTYGFFLASQVSISSVPFLSPGFSVGIARRNFVTRESQLSTSRKVQMRHNRLFYGNIELACYNYRYVSSNSHYLRGVPIGAHIGWYFMNSNSTSLKKFQGTWNIELGMRSPIILETSGSTPIWPMYYFSYRYYLGAYKLKKEK